MLIGNIHAVANGFRPIFDLSQIDNSVSVFRSDSEAVEVVDDGHVEGAFRAMVECVHDLRTQNVAVQSGIKSLRHNTVEFLQNLALHGAGHNL